MESSGEVFSQGRGAGAGAKAFETQTGHWVEDKDSDLLQEQTQAICEELQRRGASTTLALARHLGFEKSSAINPLMSLLLEKNVLLRVSDIPPIWSLSPRFPMSPHFGTNPDDEDVEEVVLEKKSQKSPLPESVSKPAITFKEHLLSENIEEKIPVSTNQSSPNTSLAPLPALTFREHVIPTPPPRPVFEERRQDQHRRYRQNQPRGCRQETVQSYRQSQRQVEKADKGPNRSQKKRKTEEYLTELQLRILYELKEIGPTKTIELSKKLGLVTCRDVNPSLYDLQNKSLVVKINDAPVVWQLYDPE